MFNLIFSIKKNKTAAAPSSVDEYCNGFFFVLVYFF